MVSPIIKNDVIMNKSIHFCVISVTFSIIVLQLCFMPLLLPYYVLLLCTLVVKSLFMTEINICLQGTPNPEEDTEL